MLGLLPPPIYSLNHEESFKFLSYLSLGKFLGYWLKTEPANARHSHVLFLSFGLPQWLNPLPVPEASGTNVTTLW